MSQMVASLHELCFSMCGFQVNFSYLSVANRLLVGIYESRSEYIMYVICNLAMLW